MGYDSEFDTAVSRHDFSHQLLCNCLVGTVVSVSFPEGAEYTTSWVSILTRRKDCCVRNLFLFFGRRPLVWMGAALLFFLFASMT